MDEIVKRLREIREALEKEEDIENSLIELDQLMAELESGYF